MPSPIASALLNIAKWLAGGLTSLLLLGGAMVVVENGRGDRAWRACERLLTARGETLAFSAFAEPRVPEARNLLAAPVLKALLYSPAEQPPASTVLGGTKLSLILGAVPPKLEVSALPAILTAFEDNGLFRETRSAEPVRDLLSALEPAAPLLDSVRQAAQERPEVWLPPVDPIKGPNLQASSFLLVGRALAFRAWLHAVRGRTDDAFADIDATLRLAEAMRTGTKTLLQTMVGEALVQTLAPALEHGCRRHLWTDAQLATLQERLARRNGIADLSLTLQVERAWAIGYLDTLDTPGQESSRPWWLIRGWTQQNQARIFHFFNRGLEALNPTAGTLQRDALLKLQADTEELVRTRGPYVWFARLSASRLARVIPEFAESVNGTNRLLAMLVLERHWLAHREYPSRLTEVRLAPAPKTLRDALDGQPLGYTRLSAENYSLSHLLADGRTRAPWTFQPGVQR